MRAIGPKWLLPLALIFGLFSFLALNWHSHSPGFDYHSELWADRAGYHVYLPAMIDYRFDPSLFPDKIDTRTGNGFRLDSIPGRVFTKYTCGVALLRSPFYLLGRLLAPDPEANTKGFSTMDNAMVDLSAAFYGSLGIILLWGLLRRRFGRPAALISTCAVLVGTNLLYYIVADPGMSHAYSFFLFVLFMFIVERACSTGWTLPLAIGIGGLMALISLVRPTNILFLPIGWFLVTGSPVVAVTHVKKLFRPRYLLPAALAGIIVWTPQLLYWCYLYGKPVVWSYGQEGFSNWSDPQLMPFWFAPYNGLFTYAPVLFVTLLFSLWRVRSAPVTTAASWSAFLLVSYLSASWFSWTFGCGFGARNMVEYSAVFAFPLAGLLREERRVQWPLRGLLALCAIYTVKLMYSYDSCWFGETWDWPMFSDLLLGPTK